MGLAIVIRDFYCKGFISKSGLKCFGGRDRNRTDVQGFAILCMTTLPPGQIFLENFIFSKSLLSGYKDIGVFGQALNFIKVKFAFFF